MLIGYTTSHSLHAKVFYAEGMLTLKMSGLMTVDSFRSVALYAAQRAATHPWTVVVYDMLGAIVALDMDMPPIESALTRIGRPGCYITTDDTQATMHRICMQLAQLGVERRSFTSGDAAYGWARLRALQVVAHSERALARAREARALEAAAQLEQVLQSRLPARVRTR
jgi:hypothetical protein